MKLTDAQKRYENAFLVELAECRTMEEVRELITDTWSPDDIFDDEDLQRWAIRYAEFRLLKDNRKNEKRLEQKELHAERLRNRLRAEVSARGRDIANLLEQIEAKDLEIAALKVERDKYRAERCNCKR